MIRRRWISRYPITASYIDFSMFQSDWCFFFTEDEKEQFMMQLSNVQLQEIQKDADRICKRFFRILGSGICDVGEKLPWHIDFKVGYEWKSQYYKR